MELLKQMPKEKALDSTVGFLKDGYLFILNRMKKNNTDVFTARFLGKKVTFLMGREAAKLFYDEQCFIRKGVAPMRVQNTLFGKQAIQGLDGKNHKQRKALFMSLLTEEYEKQFLTICEATLDRYSKEWEKKPFIVLYKESQRVLFESVCQWAGISYEKTKINDYAEDFGRMIYGFGRVGSKYRQGKEARKEMEAFVRNSVIALRQGRLKVDKKSPLYQMSMYKENGRRLSAQIAAVELINLLRPMVAIATYVTFLAVALETCPECKVKIAKQDPLYLEMFCEEVRRFYPFGPFVGAKVKQDFVWKNYLFKKNSLVVLDIYGTNHDPKLWKKPDTFRPERFAKRKKDLFDFIPQGGGKMHSGHRCAGDRITLKVMEMFAEYLVNRLTYVVPTQNLTFSLRKMPTLPKSGFIMKNIKRKVGR